MKILHITPSQDGFYMPAEFAPHEDCLMICLNVPIRDQ